MRTDASGRDGEVGESFIPLANPPLRIFHTVTLGCQVSEMLKWPYSPKIQRILTLSGLFKAP